MSEPRTETGCAEGEKRPDMKVISKCKRQDPVGNESDKAPIVSPGSPHWAAVWVMGVFVQTACGADGLG